MPAAPDLSAARAAMASGDMRAAATRLKEILAADPDAFEALDLLAAAEYSLLEFDACEATAERMIALAPERTSPLQYLRLAKLNGTRGHLEGLRHAARRGLAAHPRNLDLVLMAAGGLQEPEACAELEDYLRSAPPDPRAAAQVLKRITIMRHGMNRAAAGLTAMGVSWADTCRWLDPEGLDRLRGLVVPEIMAPSPRSEAVLDAACIAVVDGRWDLAGELLDGVRAHARGTFADYTTFGAAFHNTLGSWDAAEIARRMPEVRHVRTPAPRQAPTLFLGSDGKYFTRFTLPFLQALEDLKAPVDVQVHLMDRDQAAWTAAAAALERFAHVSAGLSVEDPGAEAADASGVRLYCHAIRFVRLYQEALRRRAPVCSLDADVLVRRDPRPLLKRIADHDLALWTTTGLFSPPSRIAGGLLAVSPTERGLEFARRVAAYILHWRDRKTWGWGVDQAAFFSVYAHLHLQDREPRTLFLTPKDVSIDEQDDCVFYFPTGIKKFQLGDKGP